MKRPVARGVVSRKRQLARALAAAACALISVSASGIIQFSFIGSAIARDGEDDGRDREEQRRQRDEARREREAQREEARREREARRAAQEEEKRQREQERAASTQVKRDAAQDDNRRQRDSDLTSKMSRNDGANTQPASRSDDAPSPSAAHNDDGDGTPSKNNKSGDNSASKTPKPQGGDRGDRKTEEVKKNDKDRKSGDKEDDGDKEAVEPEEPEEPPRTLIDWWKKITNDPGTTTASDTNTKPPATPVTTPAISTKPAVTPSAPVADSQGKAPATVKKTATSSPAQGKSETASASSASVIKRSSVDWDLLRQGEFRERQILASGLDKAAQSKVEAMGFKPVASVRGPGFSEPVLKLAIPSGMSESAAQKLLDSALPQAHFGPNHVFTIRPQSEQGKAYPTSNAAGEGSKKCGGAVCFARDLIQWKTSLGACAASVRIGVIDTSFDMAHPSLKGRNYTMKDFRARALELKTDWHGTAVLSVLAGDEHSSTPGLVPRAQFALASTFGADSNGQASADAMSVLAALAWLDGKADIINMSFSGPRNEQIEIAIRAMSQKGVIFVAAAGNQEADGPPSYPAAYPEVIAVTAVSSDKRAYSHATHGSYVDMAAPGVNVFTALPLGQSGLRTGTSFATPFVTGLIAAMPAARKGIQSKSELLSRISIEDLGTPGRDPVYGEGLPVAPSTCDEIGGVAGLPWRQQAQSNPQWQPETSTFSPASTAETGSISPASSSMGWAFGYAP